jgi:hypothetical protein
MIADQPPPIATNRRAAWDIVIEHVESRRGISAYTKTGDLDLVLDDMRERDRIGRERYGMRLTSGNGRDHLVDAYQELLDSAVYLVNYLDERGVNPSTGWLNHANHSEAIKAVGWRVHCIQQLFWNQIDSIIQLRALICETSRG